MTEPRPGAAKTLALDLTYHCDRPTLLCEGPPHEGGCVNVEVTAKQGDKPVITIGVGWWLFTDPLVPQDMETRRNVDAYGWAARPYEGNEITIEYEAGFELGPEIDRDDFEAAIVAAAQHEAEQWVDEDELFAERLRDRAVELLNAPDGRGIRELLEILRLMEI